MHRLHTVGVETKAKQSSKGALPGKMNGQKPRMHSLAWAYQQKDPLPALFRRYSSSIPSFFIRSLAVAHATTRCAVGSEHAGDAAHDRCSRGAGAHQKIVVKVEMDVQEK